MEIGPVTTETAPRESPVIVWFRRDLRLADNPALGQALTTGRPVLPLYIHDEGGPVRPAGAASLWWLDGSLRALASDLASRGAPLILRRGDAEAELRRLIAETGATTVFLNRLFEPGAWTRDADIAHGLKAEGVDCRGFNGSLLARPGTVLTGSGGPYRVFTPFLRALLAAAEPPRHVPPPAAISSLAGLTSDALEDWSLTPTRPNWAADFIGTPGEAGAGTALAAFIAGGLATYSRDRDLPAAPGTSRLSPHLHFGELSPWRAVAAARAAATEGGVPAAEADKFVAQLGWRDFSAHLLHQFPAMADRAFRPEYDAMPWRDDPAGLAAWQTGRTGFPIVDAGMRQLWATGWMHNRVRMIVGSFLVKDLLIDWRAGEHWFWNTLVDADPGNNIQNWQWIAGSGADAAPYFRVFNPVTQGEKFDADGRYVRTWVPELRRLPDRWLHAPWTAPPEILRHAGVRLGHDYPRPLVDHAQARLRALEALRTVGQARVDADD
jgi:deoxyribodipyrimidine photo-lyase